MGGWKQKEESSLLVPSTFLFLYQPSVCLCVSRVRAYLTTNQHTHSIDLHACYTVLHCTIVLCTPVPIDSTLHALIVDLHTC